MTYTYTKFDRHENMPDTIKFEILSIIKKVSHSENNQIESQLQNMLFGLFDGYLYADLHVLALQLPTDLSANIIKLYDICNQYPKIETV